MRDPLEKLMLTTIETIIEGVEKKPWTAFINNTFAFTSVVFKYGELISKIEEAKNNPQYLEGLKQKANEKWGSKYKDGLVADIFDLIWAAMLYKVATIMEIHDLVVKHNNGSK
jgi:hypothetical protein